MLRTIRTILMGLLLLSLCAGAYAEATDDGGIAIIGGADGPTSIFVSQAKNPENESSIHKEAVSDTISVQATVGYDGAIRYGYDIPVKVTLINKGTDREGVVAVNLYAGNDAYDRVENDVTLKADSETVITIPVTVLTRQELFTVEYLEDGNVICAVNVTNTLAIPINALAVGVVSRDANALSYLNVSEERDRLTRGEIWQTVSLTRETFPDSQAYLTAFGVLVFDGVDFMQFADSQKSAFDTWLRSGGIAIVGGGEDARETYSFFEPYTKITAGEVVEAGDITPSILSFLGLSGDPYSDAFTLSQTESEQSPLIQGDMPILYKTDVDNGVIFSCAFSLSADAWQKWDTAYTLWQRILLETEPTLYTNAFLNKRDTVNYWDAQTLLTQIGIDNDAGLTPIYILLAVFVIVSGFVAYFLLKRFDRRELLWGVIPLLSALIFLLFWLIGNQTTLNDPVAASVSYVRVRDNGAKITTMAGISVKDRKDVFIRTDDNLHITPLLSNNSYYTYSFFGYAAEDDAMIQEPTTLRYLYRMVGDTRCLGLPESAPWSVRYFSIERETDELGDIDANVWMEDGGLRAEIANRTEYAFTDGYLITPLGYVSVPSLLPGETVQTGIVYSDTIPSGLTDAGYIVVDGEIIRLYNPNQVTDISLPDVYTIMDAIVYPERQADPMAVIPASERGARERLYNVLTAMLDNQTQPWMYIGFNDEIGKIALYVGDKQISREAGLGVVSREAKYEPIGHTGVVYYPYGELPCHSVSFADGNAPVMSENAMQSSDLNSTDPLTFGFVIPDATQIALSELRIVSRYTQGLPVLYLYNVQTGLWDQKTVNEVVIQGDEILDYVTDAGELFVQARVNKNNTNGSAYLQAPGIEVTGRVK